MKNFPRISMLAAGVAIAVATAVAFEAPRHEISFGVAPAAAKDALGSDRWNFRHRGSAAAMNKATTMWQVERAGTAGSDAGGSGTSGGSAGGGAGGGTAIANYNDIDVFFAEDSEGSVTIMTDQDSTGDQTTRSTDMINFIDSVETAPPSP